MKLLKRHWKSFLADPWQGRYLFFILAVNIPGSVYGYYWYSGQLSATPKSLWLFVPDSPLATTLFVFVLILGMAGYRHLFLETLAYMSCIKYGLWAAVVISDFWIRSGEIETETAMLWISHLGMAAQAVIYLGTIRFKRRTGKLSAPVYPGRFVFFPRGITPAIAGVAAWLLLNDFLDYRLGIHPYLYYSGQEPLASASAWGLSAAVILSVFIYFRKSVGHSG